MKTRFFIIKNPNNYYIITLLTIFLTKCLTTLFFHANLFTIKTGSAKNVGKKWIVRFPFTYL